MRFASSVWCNIRITLVLVGVLAIGLYMFDVLRNAFLYNVEINSIILLCTAFGIFKIYKANFLISKELWMLSKFNKLPKEMVNSLRILKPVTYYLSRNNKLISQSKVQSIMAGIEKNVDDMVSVSKYIAGILIFLGLLGTFWGLSHTIGNVANLIDKLGMEGMDTTAAFVQLKNSLKVPLAGMGIAFGCSLFGLAGSLLVGFFVINYRRVSDEFLNKVEEWLAKTVISLDVSDESLTYHGQAFSMGLLEKTVETIYVFQNQIETILTDRSDFMTYQKDMMQKISKINDSVVASQENLRKFAANQLELQDAIGIMAKRINEMSTEENSDKLSSIEDTLNRLLTQNIDGNSKLIQSLGSDIRMVNKTLSSLIRE